MRNEHGARTHNGKNEKKKKNSKSKQTSADLRTRRFFCLVFPNRTFGSNKIASRTYRGRWPNYLYQLKAVASTSNFAGRHLWLTINNVERTRKIFTEIRNAHSQQRRVFEPEMRAEQIYRVNFTETYFTR